MVAVPAGAQIFVPGPDLDVPFFPTPMPVVTEMLRTANVSAEDMVYDLGCGDGRIVIAAARDFGARGVGIDIDPLRVWEATLEAEKAGVVDRVRFLEGDIFKADIHEATVVTLYLLPSVNLQLRPKLLRDLRAGTRIVSHNYDMADWKPEKTITVTVAGREHTIYYWVVPPRDGQ
jgi:SAM-dependent methyltransferase